ncbi:MAG: Do family serine endopeptidase [Alphaproteobacteria bacterium]
MSILKKFLFTVFFPYLALSFGNDFMKKGFSEVGESVMPAIVSVAVISTVNDTDALKARLLYMLQSPRKDLFGQAIINGPRKVGGTGSGFIIDPRGYIVTNYHVVEDAISIKVLMNDETILKAELVGYDPGTDLAVIKVDSKKRLPALRWADSNKIKIGQWVMALGNPYGLGPTLTSGVISSSARNLDNPQVHFESAQLIHNFIQTDAAINRGNSGGPLVDVHGSVVGVNFAIVTSSGGSDGIGLAIPANMAKKITNNIINYGRIKRAWLGVAVQAVTKEIGQNLGLENPRGAIITTTTEGGPSESAGLKSGDIILSIEGKLIKDAADVRRIIGELSVGQTISVEVWRDKKSLKVKAKLDEFQSHEDYKKTMKSSKIDLKEHVVVDAFDFGVTSLTAQFRQRFGAENPKIQGVVISDLKDGGWAMKHGLAVGDIIMEVNRTSVSTIQGFKESLESGLKAKKPLLLLIYKMGMKFFVGLDKKAVEEGL